MCHENTPFHCPNDALESHQVSLCLLQWGPQVSTSRGRGTTGPLQYTGGPWAVILRGTAGRPRDRTAPPHLLGGDTQTPTSATSAFLLIAQAKSQVQGIAPVSDTKVEAIDSPPDLTPRGAHAGEKLAFEWQQTHCLPQALVRNSSGIEPRDKGDHSTGRDLTKRDHPAGSKQPQGRCLCWGSIQEQQDKR